MTAAESARWLTTLFEILIGLALLALLVFLARQLTERKARRSMRRHDKTLVGKRAMVLGDLRPGQAGSIRPLGTAAEEAERAVRSKDEQKDDESFPAMADQLISRGRVVRVTGGDEDGYLVRPL